MKTLHVYFFFNTIAGSLSILMAAGGKHWFPMTIVHEFCTKFYGKFVVINLWMVPNMKRMRRFRCLFWDEWRYPMGRWVSIKHVKLKSVVAVSSYGGFSSKIVENNPFTVRIEEHQI
jgi:hypothetical protein